MMQFGLIGVGVVATALIVAGCHHSTGTSGPTSLSTGNTMHAANPSGSANPPSSTIVGSRSASPAPTASTRQPVLGPAAVRITRAELTDAGLRLDLIGPYGASFRIRDASGHVTECGATPGLSESAAPKGMPWNSTQHYALNCASASKGNRATLLTKLKLGAFSYEFENAFAVKS